MQRFPRFNRPGLRGNASSALLGYADGDGSTLSLDFTTGQLDPRLTFTRGSNATFINSSGLVQYADANMMARSETLDASPWSLGGVSNTEEQVTNPTGGSSCRLLTVSASGGSKSIVGNMTIAQGFQYTFRIWVRAGTSTAVSLGFFLSGFQNSTLTKVSGPGTVSGSGIGATYHTVTGLTSSWTLLQLTLASTTTSGLGGWYIYPNTPSNVIGDAIYVWGAQANIGATANPYYRTTTSAYYAPRFDHDPTTLALRGLLVEGMATNFVTQSNGSTSVWGTGGNRTPTNNTTDLVSPDGTNNATKLVCGSAGAYASFATSISGLTGGETYTISYWIRGPVGHSPRLFAQNGTTGDVTATATTGTYNNTGWTRLTQTYTLPATTTQCLVYFLSTNIGTTGDTFYVYGFQMETGSGASSYIPTAASAGQRNEDSATMSSVASLGFDQYQGTFIVRGVQNKQGAFFARLLRISGTTTEPFGMPVNGATLYGTSRNSLNATIAEATRTNTLGQSFAFGMSLDANDVATAMKVSINGSGASSGRTNVGPTEAAATFSFNTNATATNYGCFAVRSVKFYPVTKTLAELNALTT